MSQPLSVREAEAAAADALRRGEPQEARRLYELVVAQNSPTLSVWFGLATACRELREPDASLAAIDKVLAHDPRNLRALLFKGDHFAGLGDERAANSFYSGALRQAASLDQVPPDLVGELQRARSNCESYARRYESHLHDKLIETGFHERQSSRRFAQSLDLVLGKKQVYLQQPSQYYFPELPQIQFYDRGQFPWLAEIEGATDDIRSELIDVLREEGAFRPYVEDIPDRPPPENPSMIGNPSWSAYFLWKNGVQVSEHAARCPKTMRALDSVPLCMIKGRTPSVLFSLLRPGTRIPAHTGYINTRLICHLPLIVPEKCVFRVGNEVRQWTVGETLLFDDTIEHEARNDSAETRVVLIFDIWRPELNDEERALVTTLLEAIDSYGMNRA
jgi:aspartyl/asparaginyl beta-hydroxylase (cupin superfamily)